MKHCRFCPEEFKIPALRMLDESRHGLLPSSRVDYHLSQLDSRLPCHRHLRLIAGAAGLTTNHTNTDLSTRLQSMSDQGHFAFLQAHRTSLVICAAHRRIDHLPPLCKYRLNPLPDLDWNFGIVLDHYAEPNARQLWSDSGTLAIPNVVPHLRELCASIDAEFQLYRHHYQTPPAQKGWVRNMFYSLTQQIIRCDPLVYALNVALRPDQNHRLVSHPYITKDADPATCKNAGFLHVDANYAQLVGGGPGCDRLTCGISLDDEDERNCTVVVPGTHLRSAEILSHLRAAGLENKTPALTTDFEKCWSRLLARTFGSPVPVPLKRYGMRISHVGVIHGSTPNVTIRRRLILPWFMGFGPDYANSDVANTATWCELAQQHRECIPPPREPSGQTPRSPLPPILPWSVHLHPSHALGRAILGQVKFEDPMVVHEMNQLFHPDKRISQRYLSQVRAQAVKDFEQAWQVVQALEYGAAGPANTYMPYRTLDSSPSLPPREEPQDQDMDYPCHPASDTEDSPMSSPV